ncbi:MAG: nitroreductase family protein [bacterium]|nr:MAG: nitroreductase family protein [bacterium]
MSGTQWIKKRRSHRTYRSDVPAEDVIRDILDCGRLAPTARNVQPWLLGAVTDEAVRRDIARLAEYGRFIADAPVCFAVFVRADEKYFMEDGCAATMNIIMAATVHGLGTCWVAGHKKDYGEEVRRLLGVPKGYTLISLIAAGYSDDRPSPKKKPLEEVTFRDRCGS